MLPPNDGCCMGVGPPKGFELPFMLGDARGLLGDVEREAVLRPFMGLMLFEHVESVLFVVHLGCIMLKVKYVK